MLLAPIIVFAHYAQRAPFPSQTPEAAAETARWLVHDSEWGTLSSLHATADGTAPQPLGTTVSFSDGARGSSTGRLFFYLMGADSVLSGDPHASFTLSEAARHNNTCGSVDPQDPRCAKLTLSGALRVCTGDDEATGRAALFARHPQMAKWPASHAFTVVELAIDDIWMIDFYGGGSAVDLGLYKVAPPRNNRPTWPPKPPSAVVEHSREAPSVAHTRRSLAVRLVQDESHAAEQGIHGELMMKEWHRPVPAGRMSAAHAPRPPRGAAPPHTSALGFPGPRPPWNETATRARWLVYHSIWSVVSTSSTRQPTAGRAWGNVRSIADGMKANSTGLPVLYLPTPDPTAKDVAADARVSLSFSEAALPALLTPGVGTPCAGTDAEDPTCARITLIGSLKKLDGVEATKAAYDLGVRHPLAPWLASGGAHTGGAYFRIELERVVFLDYYGGPAHLSVEEYLAAPTPQ